ncbi:hypothetical protein B0H34DRAFT_626235, partial [Crassisporium funariophilum]
KYLKEPVGNGGRPRIPTLKVASREGGQREVNTNTEKAQVFADAFFPKPPPTSSVPEDYNYPAPLSDPAQISKAQIERQIRHLSPYKASGPDEIPNVVLQNTYNLIGNRLLHIYQAILALRIYPPVWREFTTVVLRKPGKPSYEVPKAYQPMALLSTMAKVLTAVV